jgi:hypothetical protein
VREGDRVVTAEYQDPFALVPLWVVRHEQLTDADVRCYAAMGGLVHRKTREGRVALEEIAGPMRCSIDKVRRCWKRLEDAGALVVERSDGYASRVVLVMHEPEPLADLRPLATPLANLQSEPLSLESLEVVSFTTASSPFDAFWSEYPRKVSKPDAARVFAALLKERPQPDIAAGLERWLVYWRANGDITPGGAVSQYVPHPATWLRGRRWEAETPVVKPRQSGANRAGAARETLTEDPRRQGESRLIEL